jgi:uncharacterized protein
MTMPAVKKTTQIVTKPKCLDHLEGKSSKIVIEKACVSPGSTNPPTFILGFTGTGMVGVIVVNELITQLKMDLIGYVLTEELPPITVFYNGELRHPFRIYHSDEYNLIVSICEVPFLPGQYADLARTLMSWALNLEVADVMCIQGLADSSIMIQEGPYEVFGAGEPPMLEKFKKFDIQTPPRGLIMGPEAAILNECLNNRINGSILLTPANPQIPAPEGAVAILKKLGELYGFKINADSLLEQAKEIKQNLLELTDRTNKVHSQEYGQQGPRDESHLYA